MISIYLTNFPFLLSSNPKQSAKNLILNSNVEILCTTDDPMDSLEYHIALKNEGFKTKVLPTC